MVVPSPRIARAARGFAALTELAGTPVTRHQLRRIYNRYRFAASFCAGQDVLELACGSGQGLGYLAGQARSVVGGDIDEEVLALAHRHYRDRIRLQRLDAHRLPFPAKSFDRVLLYEAIYYLRDPSRFAGEARRVLRPRGVLLLATANKDLPDFNPSPSSRSYLNPPELSALLEPLGFQVQCYGEDPVDRPRLQERLFCLLKRSAVRLGAIPGTMEKKRLLKRIFLGPLVPMPAEVSDGMAPLAPPAPIPPDRPDTTHRVIHCVARLPG